MRILHVTPTYLPATRYGGPIYSVHGLARAQVALGHKVNVVCTSVDGPNDSDVVHESLVDMDGVGVHYYRSRFGRRTYYSGGMRRAMRQAVAAADIVHLHSVFLWPTLCAARAAMAMKIPYVVSPRGMLVADLIADRGKLRKKMWLALFERRTLAHAAWVHVTSLREEQAYRELGLPSHHLVRVSNGVDAPDCDDLPHASSNLLASLPDRYVLYLGRLSWKKRIDCLISAMVDVPPDLHLVVAGPDDESLLPKLQQFACEHGVSRRIHWVGQVDSDLRWHLLCRASSLVLISSNENFGNVVAEAMAVGCPVVVSGQVGASEIVAKANAGIVVEATPIQTARAIASIALDKTRAAGYCEAGRQYAREHLSWNSIASQLCQHYALAQQ